MTEGSRSAPRQPGSPPAMNADAAPPGDRNTLTRTDCPSRSRFRARRLGSRALSGRACTLTRGGVGRARLGARDGAGSSRGWRARERVRDSKLAACKRIVRVECHHREEAGGNGAHRPRRRRARAPAGAYQLDECSRNCLLVLLACANLSVMSTTAARAARPAASSPPEDAASPGRGGLSTRGDAEPARVARVGTTVRAESGSAGSDGPRTSRCSGWRSTTARGSSPRRTRRSA